MTLAEFTALLDRHGGHSEHWPASARAAALALVAASPAAARLLDDTRRIEALMRRHDPGGAIGSASLLRLTNVVLAQVPRPAPAPRRWGADALARCAIALGAGQEWGMRLAAAVAVAAALGLVTGAVLPAGGVHASSALELLALSTTYLPLDTQ